MVTDFIQTIRPDIGYEAMRSVRVMVDPNLMDEDALKLQDKNITITENGLNILTPDIGYQGLGEVQITTNVPSDVNNQNKSIEITQNGNRTITADQGYSGLGTVTLNVNVPENEQLSIQQVKRYELTSVNSIDRILPDNGYDAMYSVEASVDVSNLLSALNLSITSEDLYDGRATLFGNVIAPGIGWNRYTINVNVSDLIGTSKEIINKFRVYYVESPTGGSNIHIDINSNTFTYESGSTLSISQGYGYIIYYLNDSNNWVIGYVNGSNNTTINIHQGYYYHVLGAAKYCIGYYSYNNDNEIVVCNRDFQSGNTQVIQGRIVDTFLPDRIIGINLPNNN